MTEIGKLRDFWINKIEKLLVQKEVADWDLEESGWERKIWYQKPYYSGIDDYGKELALEIYNKATTNITPAPTNLTELLLDLPANDEGKSAIAEYAEIIRENLIYWGKETEKERKENDLYERIFIKRLVEKVLKYSPTGTDFSASDTKDPRLFFNHLKNNVLKKRSIGKILKSERRLTNQLNQLSTNLKTILGTTTLPNDWPTKLAKKDDLDTANAKITTLTTERDQYKTKADKYDHIHTKLNGKVSDTELQALLDTIPTCSYNDYDTIKSERDTLKTENTQLKEHNCDCANQVAQKETEIITKIITDLSLSTERERENVLDAVITEIKGKITPPTDNSADKQKITELEAKITSLQAPKSLNDVKVSSEVKKEITKLSQDLGISNQTFTEELKSVDSYQQLANLQNKVFKEELSKETDSKNSAITLNYCLGALSIGSLLILTYLLIKRTTFTPELGNKKEKE